MKPLTFDNVGVTCNAVYCNSFPFVILVPFVAWKRNLILVANRFHISFALLFPIYISHFVETQVCVISMVYESQKSSIFIQHTFILTSYEKYPEIISIFNPRKLRLLLSVTAHRNCASIQSQIFPNIYILFSQKSITIFSVASEYTYPHSQFHEKMEVLKISN